MAELTTIARPYAQAAFKRASETGRLAEWTEMLAYAAAVAEDETVARLASSPRVDKQRFAELFIDICGEHLDEEGRNLIKTLAENRRLAVLPKIAEVYEAYRAEAEKSLQAQIITALPVDEEQVGKVAKALQARLGREVRLTATTDGSLIGGAVVRAGDMVIDGSVRGRLAKLASALSR
ncbi:MAG: F0F1 ATP synthase subunit delta [Gammaproteobacteria bacterium]|nr:F0F1 ATP synthase subunit delta [Gammaproteobacteria bacterium]NIR98838.1 F0F1 ATP synthase subunit delta [Gammaproteobacteria bacterium]